MREQIAEALKWFKVETLGGSADAMYREQADQILTLIREEIAKVENPFGEEGMISLAHAEVEYQIGFERCRHKVLSLLDPQREGSEGIVSRAAIDLAQTRETKEVSLAELCMKHRREGRKELVEWLQEFAIHGGQTPLVEVLDIMAAHSPFMGRVKGDENRTAEDNKETG